MKKTKTILAIALVLLLALSLLGGCGASSDSASANTATASPSASSSSSTNGSYDYSYGTSYDKAESEEYYEVTEEPAMSENSSSGTGTQVNAKLIYTAHIDLESTEFDTAVAALESMVAEMGGYFESSNVNNYSSYRYADYTVRVPAENFQSFCDRAGTICQLNNISKSAQDVSEYYYDTEARLVTQQTKLARLQELLAKAESMEDIITIESEISETELQIENLTGTLRKYDSLVGYSTIYISLCEVYELTVVEEPVIGFGAKLVQAFQSGCTGFVKSLQRTLLSMARNWVGWLFFLVVVAVVVILMVRFVRRRKARFAPQKQEEAPKNEKEKE